MADSWLRKLFHKMFGTQDPEPPPETLRETVGSATHRTEPDRTGTVDRSRPDVAYHIANTLGYPGKYPAIWFNLGHATPGEIIWASSANAASLREAAREKPDRYAPNGKPVNPFWYQSYAYVE